MYTPGSSSDSFVRGVAIYDSCRVLNRAAHSCQDGERLHLEPSQLRRV